jgi:hypothetical protein
MFDVIRDLLRCPDDHAMSTTARGRADELAHRIAAPPCLREGCVKEGMVAIAATGKSQIVRQWFVKFEPVSGNT